MAYVTDTPSRRLDSYIILTLADVSRRPDSLLFHTSADGWPGRHAPTHQCMHIPYCVGEADQLYVCRVDALLCDILVDKWPGRRPGRTQIFEKVVEHQMSHRDPYDILMR